MTKPSYPPLKPPNTHHAMAAMGWLELGNPTESWQELARIPEDLQSHPDVVEIRYSLCVSQNLWKEALSLAQYLIDFVPDSPAGWLHKSYALRRVEGGGIEQARDCLGAVASRFTDCSIVPYNLACYECLLGEVQKAKDWLSKAVKIAGKKTVKTMALKDPDLEVLWPQIQRWKV